MCARVCQCARVYASVLVCSYVFVLLFVSECVCVCVCVYMRRVYVFCVC